MGLISWIKGVFQKVVPIENIEEAFKDLDVHSLVTSKMNEEYLLWRSLYQNKPYWTEGKQGRRAIGSLNLPASISRSLATSATVEFESKIEGDGEHASYLNGQYQWFLERIRELLEKGCALGTVIIKPWVQGNLIPIDIVTLDRFVPTAANGRGEITGGVFIDKITRNNTTYTKLEYHSWKSGNYDIYTKAYENNSNSALGREIPLTSVPEWAQLTNQLHLGPQTDPENPNAAERYIEQPLFAVFKYPAVNRENMNSPLAPSCYAGTVDLFRQADEQWDRILWEYTATEAAIDVDTNILQKDDNGNASLPTGNERLWRKFDLDGQSTDPITPYSPEIRDTPLFNGLDNILRRIEYDTGLSDGELSRPSTVEVTATQIAASKQRYQQTVKQIQHAAEDMLNQLVYAMDYLSRLYLLSAPGDYSLSINWKDSILEDENTFLMFMQSDVTSKIIPSWMYIAKKYGVTEDKAKEIAQEAMESQPSNDDLMGFKEGF